MLASVILVGLTTSALADGTIDPIEVFNAIREFTLQLVLITVGAVAVFGGLVSSADVIFDRCSRILFAIALICFGLSVIFGLTTYGSVISTLIIVADGTAKPAINRPDNITSWLAIGQISTFAIGGVGFFGVVFRVGKGNA